MKGGGTIMTLGSVFASGIVFVMFVVSEFVSYRSAKKYEATIKKMRHRIDSQSDTIGKQKDDIDRLSRRILEQHKTIVQLTEENERLYEVTK